MPRLPGEQMVDRGVLRPLGAGRASSSTPTPSRSRRSRTPRAWSNGWCGASIVRVDDVVDRVAEGDRAWASERTVERRFRWALGLTPTQLAQIRRAREAVAKLQAGGAPAEVAAELGYADQPHLTRSLRRFMGQTPGEIAGPGRRNPDRPRRRWPLLSDSFKPPTGRRRYGPPMDTTPFRIDVPQADLDDLRERLARTRWPEAPEGAGWSMGADAAFMRRLADHWLNRLRLARPGGGPQRPSPVRRRRGRHGPPLRPRPRQGPEPDARCCSSTAPGLVLPIPRGRRPADGPGGARRRSRRVVRRGRAVAARVRVLRPHAAVGQRDAPTSWRR